MRGDRGDAKSSNGILAKDAREEREGIVEMLTKAYWMEIETVMSYLANSVNLDTAACSRGSCASTKTSRE